MKAHPELHSAPGFSGCCFLILFPIVAIVLAPRIHHLRSVFSYIFSAGCLLLAWQIHPHAEVATAAGDPFRAFSVELAAIVSRHR